jgi:signal-transduction protein with cAMP-binding, CBS, and nucleotidyltransferase domain
MGTRYRDPKTPQQREEGRTYVVRVEDLMAASVMTATPHQSVEHVRALMSQHGIHALPVVDPDGRPIGIVTSSDLIDDLPPAKPVGQLMTRKVFTIPRYEDPSMAARVMRNHRIHHLVVTHESRVVGMLSSFDLLALIEDRRFAFKQRPTSRARGVGSRKREESRPTE